jgi:SpoVK/Ycf46/Vps4 family AAA+-type ATPase
MRRQDPAKFDLDKLSQATNGFSGAEIEQVVISGLYRALQKKQPLTTDSLIDSANSTVPLSIARREDIEQIREMAKGRFTPVA